MSTITDPIPTHRAAYRAPWIDGAAESSNAACETGRGDCWGVYGTPNNGCPTCDPVGYIPSATR